MHLNILQGKVRYPYYTLSPIFIMLEQGRTWPYKTSVTQFFSQVVLYIISHNVINKTII